MKNGTISDFFDPRADIAADVIGDEEEAAEELRRMNENMTIRTFTDIGSLIAGFADLADRRPTEDCTTLPQRKRKHRDEWEQSL